MSSAPSRHLEIFEKQGARRWELATRPISERLKSLKRLRTSLLAHREQLGEAMHKDFSKPKLEVELTELNPVLSEIDDALRNLEEWAKPHAVPTPMMLMGTRSEVRFEARGRVLILAPWNYPVFLLLGPLVGAIAAGNAVMLRPSEKVPHTADVLAKILREAFDESEVACVQGGVELAQDLLKLPFDHFFFTGSTRVGKQVMKAAAEHLAGVTLELGGKSPVIVDESFDPALAAERIVWGKFLNAGQTCVAPDYVLVHKRAERALVEALKRAIANSYGADEGRRARSPDFARLVDDQAWERVTGLLRASVEAGAQIECGGQTDAATRYISPTVVTRLRGDSALMTEEIFGPVLPIVAVESLDEAIAFVRARAQPLALYVFSNRRAAVEKILSSTSAGGTCVNNVVLHLANPHLPFGGVGPSGLGNYHGFAGFRAFSHERSVMRQGRLNGAKMFFPPYSADKLAWFRRLSKLLG